MEPTPHDDGHADGPPRCGAKLRQRPGFCRKQAGWGTTHLYEGRCRLHGGNTRTQVVAAERQIVQGRARQLLGELGHAEPVTDPAGELQRLAGEVLAMKDAAAVLVGRLESPRYIGANGTEQLRAEVAVYERAVDRAARLLGEMVRMGFEERQVRLAEAQGTLVAAVLDGAMDDAGLDGQTRERLRAALAARLRAVSAERRGLT